MNPSPISLAQHRGPSRPTRRGGAALAATLVAGAAALLSACGGSPGGPKGPITATNNSPVLAGQPVTAVVSLATGQVGDAAGLYSTVQLGTATGYAVGGDACGAGVDFISVKDQQLYFAPNVHTATVSITTCPNTSFKPNNRFELQFEFEGQTLRGSALILNTAAGGPNDSGITQCLNSAGALVACSATDLPGQQDGQAGRDSFGPTGNDSDGRAGFSLAAFNTNCVKDNVTGLVWDGATSVTATLADAQAAATQANTASRCGQTNWRLPTVGELMSIVDGGATSGARIPAIFAGTPSNAAWTGSAYAPDARANWVVDFASGAVAFESATNPLAKTFNTRLVAAAAPASPACDDAAANAPLTDNGNGTVSDSRTGLMWMQCTDGQSGSDCATGSATAYASFGAALQRAVAVNASSAANKGFSDWRVPNRNELASLVQWNCGSPAITRPRFPNTPAGSAWTSSPAAAGLAWYVDFTDGNVGPGGVNGSRYLRLVRAGQ